MEREGSPDVSGAYGVSVWKFVRENWERFSNRVKHVLGMIDVFTGIQHLLGLYMIGRLKLLDFFFLYDICYSHLWELGRICWSL